MGGGQRASQKTYRSTCLLTPLVEKLLAESVLWSKVIWFRSKRKKNKRRIGTRQIRRQMKKLGIKDAFKIPLQEAKERRRAVRKRLRLGKKDNKANRKKFLQELAEARVKANKTTAAAEIKKHLQTEKQRETWRSIGAVNKKKQCHKVTKLWVQEYHTDSEGNRVMTCCKCVTKPAMEKAVIKENETRFTRCCASAFFQGLLALMVGVMFTGQWVKEILTNCWQPPPPNLT